jgi:hypothetical protein
VYFKDFMDKIEDEPEVAEELGLLSLPMFEILLSVTILKSRLQGINPVKLLGLYPKKKKTMLYLGNLGLRKLFNI